MGTVITNATDVVTFLKEQHREVAGLLEQVLATHAEARAKSFFHLRRTLAVHETAEEEIVHPTARRVLANGNIIVEARLLEEREAKKALTELEKLDVDSPEFESAFRELKASVLVHAEAEERQEFKLLGDQLEPARLERMRKAVALAEAIAPTRPHGVESAMGNMLAGPFVSMLDRSRDALAGKSR